MQLILQANNIKKQYGTRTVLNIEGIQIYEGDKIGIVGLNGAGKTTLLNILCGEDEPDSGNISAKSNVAYIRQFEEQSATLSGGENVKQRIQRETAAENTIVFADEPTANLDSDGIKWVKSKLMSAKTVLLISHDRQLLDDICTRIIEIKDGAASFFTGNYTDYLEQIELEQDKLKQKHDEYNRKKAQLLDAIRVREQKIARQKKQKKAELKKNSSEARLGGHKRAASIKKQEHDAKIIKNRMERLEDAEVALKPPKFRMNFSLTNPPKNKNIIICENLSFYYGEKQVLRGASFVVPLGKKIAVTGKNGSGKTTLLKLIYNGHPGITKVPKLRLGYFRQGLENLDSNKTVLENVMQSSVQDSTSVHSILSGLLFREDGFGKKAAVLSGGEKIRLSLAMLIASGCNALMLDEPTNYLDIRSVEAVQSMIKNYPGTVILVSHDSRFVKETTQMEFIVENGKVTAIENQKSAPKTTADKMLLEIRRTRLVAEISSAAPEKKTLLEEEYNRIIKKLAEI